MEKRITKRKRCCGCSTTAMLMALNVAMRSFGVPVPGGHLYMNDIVICTAAILLDPLGAFLVGGVGAFLGDLLFYPTPIFVSRHTWFAGGCDFGLCAPCDEEASRAGFGTWRGDWRGHHGRGLFAGPRVHLQHAGIRDAEAALPDFAGGGRRGGRHGAVLEMWHP